RRSGQRLPGRQRRDRQRVGQWSRRRQGRLLACAEADPLLPRRGPDPAQRRDVPVRGRLGARVCARAPRLAGRQEGRRVGWLRNADRAGIDQRGARGVQAADHRPPPRVHRPARCRAFGPAGARRKRPSPRPPGPQAVRALRSGLVYHPRRPHTHGPAARLSAQAVRPSLPSELYEQVNALHWRVQKAVWQPDLYQFLMDVQMSIRLVDGLLEDTMFHDEARDFVRLGKFLERAANVTHVVTYKSADLADTPEDALEWTAVLKSCFAFESYQSRYPGGVTPDRVIECLLLDRS